MVVVLVAAGRAMQDRLVAVAGRSLAADDD
jgi:hypothetical protein